jgi:hypothetical protein
MASLHWRSLLAKLSVTVTDDSQATVTTVPWQLRAAQQKNRNDPICVCHPRWPRQVQ